MSTNKQTIDTYDRSAAKLAAYFKGIGARTKDIDLALQLADNPAAARVVEIGCGDGRDAAEIISRVAEFEGFDPSEGLLDIARQKVPGVRFVKADALTYEYPNGLDVVYAFASLLHVSKQDMPAVCQKVVAALRPGGIFYVSLKKRDEYAEEIKKDEYGERLFYFYNPALFAQLASDAFEVVHSDEQVIGHTPWFTLALRKK